MKRYHTDNYAEYECPLMVETWSVDTDEKVSERVIDHSRHSHRSWLGKHCFWAFRNGHGIVARTLPKGSLK